jgi:hypothetical protein
VVARTILTKRQDVAMDRIEAHANSIAGEHPDIAEAAERVRSARGPDEAHTRVFRLEAIADLIELIDEITEGEKADPLEAKTASELREMAKAKGVKRTSDKNKDDLIAAIRNAEAGEDEDTGDGE